MRPLPALPGTPQPSETTCARPHVLGGESTVPFGSNWGPSLLGLESMFNLFEAFVSSKSKPKRGREGNGCFAVHSDCAPLKCIAG